jgi:hypothetical protein
MHNERALAHRASGAPRSEIKEEPKAGDIRGGEYPVACARALNNSAETNSAEIKNAPDK